MGIAIAAACGFRAATGTTGIIVAGITIVTIIATTIIAVGDSGTGLRLRLASSAELPW